MSSCNFMDHKNLNILANRFIFSESKELLEILGDFLDSAHGVKKSCKNNAGVV